MPRPHTPSPAALEDARNRLSGTMALTGLGMGILAFLVAIDRPQWFHIRPATGTSVALSHAMGETGQPPAARAITAVK